MNVRIRCVLAAAGLSLSLAACAGVTSNLAFRAPQGWTGTPSMLGRMQMWLKRSGSDRNGEVVMLIKGNVDSSDLFRSAAVGRGRITHLTHSVITICSGRQAQYMTATGISGDNKRSSIEGVLADVGDSKYLAMYVRSNTDPADPSAEAAIRSLCPKD